MASSLERNVFHRRAAGGAATLDNHQCCSRGHLNERGSEGCGTPGLRSWSKLPSQKKRSIVPSLWGKLWGNRKSPLGASSKPLKRMAGTTGLEPAASAV